MIWQSSAWIQVVVLTVVEVVVLLSLLFFINQIWKVLTHSMECFRNLLIEVVQVYHTHFLSTLLVPPTRANTCRYKTLPQKGIKDKTVAMLLLKSFLSAHFSIPNWMCGCHADALRTRNKEENKLVISRKNAQGKQTKSGVFVKQRNEPLSFPSLFHLNWKSAEVSNGSNVIVPWVSS